MRIKLKEEYVFINKFTDELVVVSYLNVDDNYLGSANYEYDSYFMNLPDTEKSKFNAMTFGANYDFVGVL
jgi:hypothetical protein